MPMDTTFAAQTLHCYPPAPALRGLVSHYWLSRDGGGDRHRVLPDGCVDLVLRLRDGDGAWQAFGTSTRPSDVPVEPGCVYFGIRFQPGQSRHFLPLPGRLLTDTAQPLARPADLSAERLAELIARPDPAFAVDRLLSRWLAGQPPQPRRLDGALALLSRAAPGVSVTALSARLNLSRRQLERDFLEWVGVPPKVFMGIRRSQQALALLSRPSPAAPLADIALAAGYADQSHMTRELKRYLGVTPGAPRLPMHDVAFIQEQARAPT